MNKYITSFLCLFLLASTVSFAAELSDIDDSSADESECVQLQNNLKYKSRDAATNGEVSTLQDFLQSEGYLNSEPTGYFGLGTLRAVKAFQSASGIKPSGYIGLVSREKIRSITCTGTSGENDTLPSVTLTSNLSTIESEGKPGIVKLSWTSKNVAYCSFEKEKSLPAGNRTFMLSQTSTYTIECTGPKGTVNSSVTVQYKLNSGDKSLLQPIIEGPTSVQVGENNLYRVFSKSDLFTSSYYVEYTFDWGDDSPKQSKRVESGYSSYHTYAKAGIYTIIGTATDSLGKIMTSTIAVKVSEKLGEISLPVITSISHKQAKGGDTITVYGQGFSAKGTPSVIQLVRNGFVWGYIDPSAVGSRYPGSIKSDGTEIIFILSPLQVANMDPGLYQLRVSNPGQGESNSIDFTIRLN